MPTPNDDRLTEFLLDFNSLITMANQTRYGTSKATLAELEAHLGAPIADLPSHSYTVPLSSGPDLAHAISTQIADNIHETYRTNVHYFAGMGITGLLDLAESERVFLPGKPTLLSINLDGEVFSYPEQAVYTVTWEGSPLLVLQNHIGEEQIGSTLAAVGTAAEAFISTVRRAMDTHSIYQGRYIKLAQPDQANLGEVTARVLPRPSVKRDDVILPTGTLDKVNTHILGISANAERLQAAGQHIRRGVLLYGPPGTGKTHTISYLAGATSATFIDSGSGIGMVAQALAIAKRAQPAIVVVEDVDMAIGYDPSVLHHLLEEMDGLGADADVAVILTTNRPELLASALADRPGRIDLSVEFPLPAMADRMTILRLYSQGIDFPEESLDNAAFISEGVPASFLKELVRRTVLTAVSEGKQPHEGDLVAVCSLMQDEATALAESRGTEDPEDSTFGFLATDE